MRRWFGSRRRLRQWSVRSRPHLVAFNAELDIVATATEANLVFIADQLDAAVEALADYLRSDPCPDATLAVTYSTVVLIVGAISTMFSAWHRMTTQDRHDAVERTRWLVVEAESVAGALAPFV